MRFKLPAAIVAVAACLLVPGVVMAQTSRTATISFTKPIKYADGTDIPAGTVLTYAVYQGAKGSTKTKVGTITGTTTTINSGLQLGETCWQVSVVTATGKESALSNEGCKTFDSATEAVVITVT